MLNIWCVHGGSCNGEKNVSRNRLHFPFPLLAWQGNAKSFNVTTYQRARVLFLVWLLLVLQTFDVNTLMGYTVCGGYVKCKMNCTCTCKGWPSLWDKAARRCSDAVGRPLNKGCLTPYPWTWQLPAQSHHQNNHCVASFTMHYHVLGVRWNFCIVHKELQKWKTLGGNQGVFHKDHKWPTHQTLPMTSAPQDGAALFAGGDEFLHQFFKEALPPARVLVYTCAAGSRG